MEDNSRDLSKKTEKVDAPEQKLLQIGEENKEVSVVSNGQDNSLKNLQHVYVLAKSHHYGH